jgi:hypothetical protein
MPRREGATTYTPPHQRAVPSPTSLLLCHLVLAGVAVVVAKLIAVLQIPIKSDHYLAIPHLGLAPRYLPMLPIASIGYEKLLAKKGLWMYTYVAQ